MNALTIADLPYSQDLDREARATIIGGKTRAMTILGKKCAQGVHFPTVTITALTTTADELVETFMQGIAAINV